MKQKFKLLNKVQLSPMELRVKEELDKLKIKYYTQVEFSDCINPLTNYKLSFDFYLPNFNLLIEYDGINYHSSKKVKQRDQVKNDYAKKKSIRLVRLTGNKELNIFFSYILPEIIKGNNPKIKEKEIKKKQDVKPTFIKTEYKISKRQKKKLSKEKKKNDTKQEQEKLNMSRERSKNFIPQPLKRIVIP